MKKSNTIIAIDHNQLLEEFRQQTSPNFQYAENLNELKNMDYKELMLLLTNYTVIKKVCENLQEECCIQKKNIERQKQKLIKNCENNFKKWRELEISKHEREYESIELPKLRKEQIVYNYPSKKKMYIKIILIGLIISLFSLISPFTIPIIIISILEVIRKKGNGQSILKIFYIYPVLFGAILFVSNFFNDSSLIILKGLFVFIIYYKLYQIFYNKYLAMCKMEKDEQELNQEVKIISAWQIAQNKDMETAEKDLEKEYHLDEQINRINETAEKLMTHVEESYFQPIQELQLSIEELKRYLPNDYQETKTTYALWKILSNGRADSWKEAVYVYHGDQRHFDSMAASMKVQQTIETAQKNLGIKLDFISNCLNTTMVNQQDISEQIQLQYQIAEEQNRQFIKAHLSINNNLETIAAQFK